MSPLPQWRTGDVSLAGIDLNKNIEWTDRYSWSPVAMQSRRLLGGGQVNYLQQLSKGRPITLSASNSRGWLTKTEVEALFAAAASVGATYSFTFFGESFSVAFNFSQGQAVQMSPLQSKQEPDAEDFFVGTIRLLTV